MMFRVGLFSGKIYTQQDFKDGKVKECGIMLSNEEECEKYLKTMWKDRRQANCLNCFRCNAAKECIEAAFNDISYPVNNVG